MIKIYKSEKIVGKYNPTFKLVFSKEFEIKVTCVEYLKNYEIFLFGFQNGEIAKITAVNETFKLENIILPINERIISFYIIGESECLIVYTTALKILNGKTIKRKIFDENWIFQF